MGEASDEKPLMLGLWWGPLVGGVCWKASNWRPLVGGLGERPWWEATGGRPLVGGPW